MGQTLNSQKTPHSSPWRASYGASFVSTFGTMTVRYWGFTATYICANDTAKEPQLQRHGGEFDSLTAVNEFGSPVNTYAVGLRLCRTIWPQELYTGSRFGLVRSGRFYPYLSKLLPNASESIVPIEPCRLWMNHHINSQLTDNKPQTQDATKSCTRMDILKVKR